MNYKQQNVAGISYVRAPQVTISNPLNGTPNIHFVEEKVLSVGDSVICQPMYGATQLIELFDDPNASFPLINPKTGEQIGTATNADLYAILHSKYRFLADKRDAQAVAAIAASEAEANAASEANAVAGEHSNAE